MIDDILMKNNQINKEKLRSNENEEFRWVNKQEIKSLYQKLIEYEKKIMLYKEMLKKDLISE